MSGNAKPGSTEEMRSWIDLVKKADRTHIQFARGTAGFGGDNGRAAQAVLHNPEAIVLDAAGNIYFADEGNSCVRMISASTGIITTVAGTPGVAGLTGNGGPATSATLNEPGTLALDAAGNLYIGDFGSHVVRKVSGGIITAFAGNGTSGNSGNGGPATSAELNLILGLAVDSAGDVYIADNESATVREVTASNGNIIAVAGTGTIGFSGDGGSAVNAELNQPFGLAVDGNNDVYIADLENHRVREVLPTH
jgi:NHL repeat